MKPEVDIVAKAAERVYRKIRQLRKSMPQRNRKEKEEFERRVKELKDGWYDEIKHLLKKS